MMEEATSREVEQSLLLPNDRDTRADVDSPNRDVQAPATIDRKSSSSSCRSILILGALAFCLGCQPSEPFLTPYMANNKGLNSSQIDDQVYPFWTWSYFAVLLPIGMCVFHEFPIRLRALSHTIHTVQFNFMTRMARRRVRALVLCFRRCCGAAGLPYCNLRRRSWCVVVIKIVAMCFQCRAHAIGWKILK